MCNDLSLARVSRSVELLTLVTGLLLAEGLATAKTTPNEPEIIPIESPSGVPSEENWPESQPEEILRLKYVEAEGLIRKSKWPEATTALKALMKIQPEDAGLSVHLADVLVHDGKRQQAIEVLARRAKQADSEKKALLQRRLHTITRMFLTNECFVVFQEGVTQLQAGKLKLARDKFQQASKKEPDNIEIMLRLAQVQVLMGNLEGALAQLQSAKALNPFEPEVGIWLGRVLYLMNQVTTAIGELEVAFSVKPDSELAVVWLSEALVSAQNYSRALSLLEADVARFPLHVLSLYTKARVRLSAPANGISDLWAARVDLQTALSRFENYAKEFQNQQIRDLEFFPQKPAKIKETIELSLANVEKQITRAEPLEKR